MVHIAEGVQCSVGRPIQPPWVSPMCFTIIRANQLLYRVSLCEPRTFACGSHRVNRRLFGMQFELRQLSRARSMSAARFQTTRGAKANLRDPAYHPCVHGPLSWAPTTGMRRASIPLHGCCCYVGKTRLYPFGVYKGRSQAPWDFSASKDHFM